MNPKEMTSMFDQHLTASDQEFFTAANGFTVSGAYDRDVDDNWVAVPQQRPEAWERDWLYADEISLTAHCSERPEPEELPFDDWGHQLVILHDGEWDGPIVSQGVREQEELDLEWLRRDDEISEGPFVRGQLPLRGVAGEHDWLQSRTAQLRVEYRQISSEAATHTRERLQALYPTMGQRKREEIVRERVGENAQLRDIAQQANALRHRFNARRYADALALHLGCSEERAYRMLERGKRRYARSWAEMCSDLRLLIWSRERRRGCYIPVENLIAPVVRRRCGESRPQLDDLQREALAMLEIEAEIAREMRPLVNRVAELARAACPAECGLRLAATHVKVNDLGDRVILLRSARYWDSVPVAA